MAITNIDLRHLRYFVAVAEQGSISRAAKRLHVSQPPLSRQIRDLEEAVKVALFQRESRPLTLTAAGEISLSQSRKVLQRFENAVILTRQTAQQDHMKLRVGQSSTASIEAMPGILRGFQSYQPEARVETRTTTTLEMIRLLRRGELDICLTVCGPSSELRDFAVEEIGAYRALAALSRQHSLQRLEQIPLGEIAQQPVISVSRTIYRWYNQYLSGLLLDYNPSFTVAEEHDRVEGVIAAVEAGRGVAFLYHVLSQVVGSRLVLREVTPSPPRAPLIVSIVETSSIRW